ncbi:MAG: sulfotransferase [Rivularia sp. (in: cyanobacteria)]
MNSTYKNITDILDSQHQHLLNNVNFRPIFIMGDHRSGTTLLHKTLVGTECFNFVQAYHVIKYGEILHNYINKNETELKEKIDELLISQGIKTRGIDEVEVNSNLPTEYGFILKNAGYESFLNHENLSLFIELCQKIQFISKLNKPLLLKNPWDFPRFINVKNAFREAKFIFIHRHPIDVINSKLKAMRTLLSSFNPYTALISKQYEKIFNNPIQRFFVLANYSSYFELGLSRVIKGTVESTSYFLDNIELLSSSDYISVKYEDICKSPEATILKILEFLELEPTVNLNYEQLIKPRPVKLLPEVERNYNKICQQLNSYLTYHDYYVS